MHARAIATNGMTTAMAIFPPDEIPPDDEELLIPEALRAEGLEDDGAALSELEADVGMTGVAAGAVEMTVITVGAAVTPFEVGVRVI
jgi:hypothetical protein